MDADESKMFERGLLDGVDDGDVIRKVVLSQLVGEQKSQEQQKHKERKLENQLASIELSIKAHQASMFYAMERMTKAIFSLAQAVRDAGK